MRDYSLLIHNVSHYWKDEAVKFVANFQNFAGLSITGYADTGTTDALHKLFRQNPALQDAFGKNEGGMSDQHPVVRFRRLPHAGDLPLPAYETAGAAAMDLRAALIHRGGELLVPAFSQRLVSAGFEIAIPPGYEGQVRPRSGLAAKHGITVLNSPGTIDSDYRGEIMVLLINLSGKAFTIKHGDRIAQLVIAPVSRAAVEEVTELDQTARGTGGFGSTGVK